MIVSVLNINKTSIELKDQKTKLLMIFEQICNEGCARGKISYLKGKFRTFELVSKGKFRQI